MSTIKADNIATLAGVSTSMANAVNGSAKAWVNFNGSGTVAIRGSYNVSSITDNGTGNYTVNFATAMVDANYGVAGIGNFLSGEYARNIQVSGTPTASAVGIVTDGATGLYDVSYVFATVFR
jgi:hypothetical protein